MIAWRDFSHIGGSEIDAARAQFLERKVAPRKAIEWEYLDAKARERAGERALIAWYKRAGLLEKLRERDRANVVDNRLHKRLARTRPTTPAGAAAFLSYVRSTGMDGIEWHEIAIDTIIRTLAGARNGRDRKF